MADYLGKALDDRVEAIRRDVSRRLTQAKRRNTRLLIGGGVVAVLCIGYLTWAARLIARHLNPEVVVAMAYEEAIRHLPAVSEETTRLLQGSAPAVTSDTLHSMTASLPALRKRAQGYSNLLLDDAFAQLGDHLATTIPHAFAEHPEVQESLTRSMSDQEIRIIARTFAIALIDALEAEGMDQDMLRQIRDRMWAIHTELDALRRGGPALTDMQRVEKRFIELAIQLIHRES